MQHANADRLDHAQGVGSGVHEDTG